MINWNTLSKSIKSQLGAVATCNPGLKHTIKEHQITTENVVDGIEFELKHTIKEHQITTSRAQAEKFDATETHYQRASNHNGKAIGLIDNRLKHTIKEHQITTPLRSHMIDGTLKHTIKEHQITTDGLRQPHCADWNTLSKSIKSQRANRHQE
mgnify:CR=1 FL=1